MIKVGLAMALAWLVGSQAAHAEVIIFNPPVAEQSESAGDSAANGTGAPAENGTGEVADAAEHSEGESSAESASFEGERLDGDELHEGKETDTGSVRVSGAQEEGASALGSSACSVESDEERETVRDAQAVATKQVAVKCEGAGFEDILEAIAPHGWETQVRVSDEELRRDLEKAAFEFITETTRQQAYFDLLAPLELDARFYPGMSTPLILIVDEEG